MIFPSLNHLSLALGVFSDMEIMVFYRASMLKETTCSKRPHAPFVLRAKSTYIYSSSYRFTS